MGEALSPALGTLAGAGYLAVFWLSGVLLARRVFPHAGDAPGLYGLLGASFGLGLLAALPALFALAFGFGKAAVLAGLAAAGLLGLAAGPRRAARAPEGRWVWRRETGGAAGGASPAPAANEPAKAHGKPFESGQARRQTLALAGCVLPLLGFAVWLLHTHTLYAQNGGYWCGQSTYGDLPMHLAFIKRIAVSGQFPPAYPLLAGQALFGYPFLCETVSSALLVLGAPLKAACLLPQALALLAVFGLFWLLALRVLRDAGRASLAFWLFFAGGGFGFFYFLGGEKGNFTRIFTAFYQTPTNYVEKNIRWANPIADLLIPQRATLFGWALLLGCLYLLYRFAFEGEARLWLPLALLAGCLPLTHTHSLLALVLMSGVYLLRAAVQAAGAERGALWRALRPWVFYAALAGALCLPQLMLVIFRQTGEGQNFLRWHWNWVNAGDNYFWFYIKNIGLVYLLLVPAFWHAGKKLRWWYAGGLAILILAECVVFQPNLYDNNKLLFVWHMPGCMLAADLLCAGAGALWRRGRGFRSRAAGAGLLAAAVFLGCFGGVLTLSREAVSRYEQFSAADVAAAEFVAQSAAPDAVFLTGTQHLNPIASLAGRQILCGSSIYVFYHGMHYEEQAAAVRELYENPSEALLARWGIDYVSISRWERGSYAVDEEFYAARCPVWYEGNGYTIYKIGADSPSFADAAQGRSAAR